MNWFHILLSWLIANELIFILLLNKAANDFARERRDTAHHHMGN